MTDQLFNKGQIEYFVGPIVFNYFNLSELLKILSCILCERQLIFISERNDLTSKVMFCLRDLLLGQTDFEWHYFFVCCLPGLLIDYLNAPFPTMIGVIRDIFDNNVDEVCTQYLKLVGTPFEIPSPIVIDID